METGLKIQKTTFQLRKSAQISISAGGGGVYRLAPHLKKNYYVAITIEDMKDRIKLLEQFIVEDPNDPFNHYALGLEYAQLDEAKALGIFERLSQQHSHYVPVYYQLGKLYERMGDNEKALQIFNQGIQVATEAKDFKTLRELRACLEELEDS